MKKFISLCFVCVFMFAAMQMSLLHASAVEDLVPPDGDYEVTIYIQQDLPEEVQQRILAHFNGEETAQPRNVTCDLFGHSNTTSTATKIFHNVYPTSPKCVKNIYNVYTCTRCGNVEEELVSSTRISSCHG